MSLIGDALRKARSEAARRGGARQWLPPLPGQHGGARHSPLGLGLVLGAAIALAAAAAGAWIAWWAFLKTDGGGPPSVAASAGEERTHVVSNRAGGDRPPVTSSGPGEERTGAPISSAGGAGSAVPVSPNWLSAPAPSVSDQQTAEVSPETVAAKPTAPASAEADSPRSPLERSTPAVERVFVLHADVGYARLDLDYIVHKPSAPFGRINGQDIVPGSIVAGFVVEEIAADYVRLSDSRGPLVLRVR